MKVLIDACVLVPTVLRRLVIGVAETGVFQPVWSPRILEEWARAGIRDGYGAETQAQIAALEARFPAAAASVSPDVEVGLSLPDPDDVHVLAAAISAGAHELLTLNTKDFPTRALAAKGIVRRHPDEFLLEAWHSEPDVDAVIRHVYARAVADGTDLTLRAVLKRSRLPRLGKAIEAAT